MFFELSMVTRNCSISVTGGVMRLEPELVVALGAVAKGSLAVDIDGVPHSFFTWSCDKGKKKRREYLIT